MKNLLSKLKRSKKGPPPRGAIVRQSNLADQKKPSLLQRLIPKKQEQDDSKKVPDFGAEFRKERNKRKRASVMKGVWSRFDFVQKLRPGIFTIGVVIAFVLIVGFIAFSHTNKIYILSDIQVTGTKEISSIEVLNSVNHLKGGSLFSFSEDGIEELLKKEFPYIKSAEVRKLLPGKLTIDIEERFPIFSYINLTGVYLVDEDRVVVNSFEVRETDPLNEEELLIIDGYGDPNADFVYEKYLSGIDDEKARKEVKWDEVEQSKKEQTLNQLRADLLIRVQTRLKDKSAALVAAGLERLTNVEGFDAEVYEVGSLFPKLRTEASRSIIRYLKDLNAEIDRLVWQSEFSVRAELNDGLSVIFSSTKDVEEQLDSLEILRTRGELKNATQIDLRSELVAIR